MLSSSMRHRGSNHATLFLMINMSVGGLERKFSPDLFAPCSKSTDFSNG